MHAGTAATLLVAAAGMALASPDGMHAHLSAPKALVCQPAAQPQDPTGAQAVPIEIILLAPEQPARDWDVRPPITVNPPALEPSPAFLDIQIQPSPRQALDQAFMPVESGGLLAQITSISASVSVDQNRFGSWGVQTNRSISISGGVFDLSGSRSFRIVGPPRLLELTDEHGVSLLDAGAWSAYPDSSNQQAFTQPSSPGSMQQQSFSVQCGALGRLPAMIGTFRLAIDTAVAGQGERYLLRAEVTEEFKTLAPGVEARVSGLTTESGHAHLGIEYRLTPHDTGGRPLFLRAQALDDEQSLMQGGESASEAQSRDAVIGTVTFWNLDTGAAPVWYVALEVIPSSQVRTIEIVEKNLPLMGL